MNVKDSVNVASMVMLMKMFTAPFMLQQDPILGNFKKEVKRMVDKGEIGTEAWRAVKPARTLRGAVNALENLMH